MKLKNLGYAAIMFVATAAFVLGAAGSSEAAKMKKAKKAAAPQTSASCLMTTSSPVCATRGGMKFTYSNACYAGNDGAKVVSSKACAPAKAMKAKKAGKKKAMKAGKTKEKKAAKKATKKAAKKPMKK